MSEVLKIVGYASNRDQLSERASVAALEACTDLLGGGMVSEATVEARELALVRPDLEDSGQQHLQAVAQSDPDKLIGTDLPLPTGVVLVRVTVTTTPPIVDLGALMARTAWSAAWNVRERIGLDEPGDRTGVPIVRMALMKGIAGTSREQFSEHWNERHVPLVLAHQPLFFRYVTNVPRNDDFADGVVEQWFEDEASFEEHDRLIATQRQAVVEDIPRFVGEIQTFLATPVFSALPSTGRP
jgi:hypothetical protein